MHTPSALTPAVADQINSDHAAAAHAHRATRRRTTSRFARFRGRRSGAPASPAVPRARTFPPFAH